MLIATYDPSTNPLNAYEWVFPLLECIHIPSFALSVGTIALVITSGLMLFTTDPLRYYYNSSFRTKIAFLVLAIVFNFTIHRSVALKATASTATTKLVGLVSIFLWVGVVFGGLFYAFTD